MKRAKTLKCGATLHPDGSITGIGCGRCGVCSVWTGNLNDSHWPERDGRVLVRCEDCCEDCCDRKRKGKKAA